MLFNSSTFKRGMGNLAGKAVMAASCPVRVWHYPVAAKEVGRRVLMQGFKALVEVQLPSTLVNLYRFQNNYKGSLPDFFGLSHKLLRSNTLRLFGFLEMRIAARARRESVDFALFDQVPFSRCFCGKSPILDVFPHHFRRFSEDYSGLGDRVEAGNL